MILPDASTTLYELVFLEILLEGYWVRYQVETKWKLKYGHLNTATSQGQGKRLSDKSQVNLCLPCLGQYQSPEWIFCYDKNAIQMRWGPSTYAEVLTNYEWTWSLCSLSDY